MCCEEEKREDKQKKLSRNFGFDVAKSGALT